LSESGSAAPQLELSLRPKPLRRKLKVRKFSRPRAPATHHIKPLSRRSSLRLLPERRRGCGGIFRCSRAAPRSFGPAKFRRAPSRPAPARRGCRQPVRPPVLPREKNTMKFPMGPCRRKRSPHICLARSRCQGITSAGVMRLRKFLACGVPSDEVCCRLSMGRRFRAEADSRLLCKPSPPAVYDAKKNFTQSASTNFTPVRCFYSV
jgi:hypothetical protein